MSGDGEVSSKARSIGVVSSDVRRPSSVQRLDVNEHEGSRLVIVTENDIGGVVDASSCTLHPLVYRALPPEAAAFGRHSRGAENSVKERDERLDGGIVSRGVKLEAVRTGHEMPVTRTSQGFAAGMGHRGAGRAGSEVSPALGGRGKEKVECKCNREVLGICEGKERCFHSQSPKRKRSHQEEDIPTHVHTRFIRLLSQPFPKVPRFTVGKACNLLNKGSPLMVYMGRNVISKNTKGFWTKLKPEVPPGIPLSSIAQNFQNRT